MPLLKRNGEESCLNICYTYIFIVYFWRPQLIQGFRGQALWFLAPKIIFSIICHSNLLTWSVSDECYSNLLTWSVSDECYSSPLTWSVSDECYSSLLTWSVSDECYSSLLTWSVSDECYSSLLTWSVSDECYSRNVSCPLRVVFHIIFFIKICFKRLVSCR